MSTDFHLAHALLPDGWASNVRLSCDDDGHICAVTSGVSAQARDTRLGTVVPGMANLHSHAFQRAMAGLSERRGPGRDSFWSWREVMYRFLDRLDPDAVEAIAALVQVEMLEAGFTAVGEFHYLHHDADGTPYDDPGEMAGRICAAANTTGIALTLLPVFYRHAGFNQTPATQGQRRFLNDPDSYARLMERARHHAGPLPNARVGIAPHSLRAASMDDITTILPLAGKDPIHIHIAEQTGEVEACLAATGQRPVRHLLDHQPVNDRWCLVHATHMDSGEIRDLAASGAVAGLCPLTEASLGDGLFPAVDYLAAGGAIGIGSDSHIRIDLAEEIRLLEYGQRLTHRQRNLLTRPGTSTGHNLFDACLAGGAQALGQPMGRLQVGLRADLVELETRHPVLTGRRDDALLDSWLFAGDARQVRSVHVGGRLCVTEGRSLVRDAVELRYANTLQSILEGWSA
ncbi:formimidoylglutamate deiminase [Maricaulis sp. W15]|uniref:formimidoylglutamate deiminase n=1 Tax=Maricaulis sp. W15 TaxID=1772333 RepID=UPI0009FA774A|nr:formimidoylglutamate deiminase [Maricaulis sp. W15]